MSSKRRDANARGSGDVLVASDSAASASAGVAAGATRATPAPSEPASATPSRQGTPAPSTRDATTAVASKKRRAKAAAGGGCFANTLAWFPMIALALIVLPLIALSVHGTLLFANSDRPLPAMPKRDLVELYNSLGENAELFGFHSGPAVAELSRKCGFRTVSSVLEIGFGSAAMGQELLETILPFNGTYEATEISSAAFHRAASRLGHHLQGTRACLRLRQSDERADDMAIGHSRASKHGSSRLNWAGFDRLVAAYVFDTLTPAEIQAELAWAHTELARGARACIVNHTRGKSLLSQVVGGIWQSLYALSAKLTGGSRAIVMAPYVDPNLWAVTSTTIVSHFGVASEVIVLRKLEPTSARE